MRRSVIVCILLAFVLSACVQATRPAVKHDRSDKATEATTVPIIKVPKGSEVSSLPPASQGSTNVDYPQGTHETASPSETPVEEPLSGHLLPEAYASKYIWDEFVAVGSVPETARMDQSPDRYYWLKSGGRLAIQDQIAQAEAGKDCVAITKTKWRLPAEKLYFKATSDPRSARVGSLSLITTYVDDQNYYRLDLQADGVTYFRKRVQGKDYTLPLNIAKGPAAGHKYVYGAKIFPSLPVGKWIGLKIDTGGVADGAKSFKLYFDNGRRDDWEFIAFAVDQGPRGSVGPFLDQEAFVGFSATGFDAVFADYRIEDVTTQ